MLVRQNVMSPPGFGLQTICESVTLAANVFGIHDYSAHLPPLIPIALHTDSQCGGVMAGWTGFAVAFLG